MLASMPGGLEPLRGELRLIAERRAIARTATKGTIEALEAVSESSRLGGPAELFRAAPKVAARSGVIGQRFREEAACLGDHALGNATIWRWELWRRRRARTSACGMARAEQ